MRESGEIKGHTHTWCVISFNILAVVHIWEVSGTGIYL